jgi:restriction system protein
MAEMTRKRQGEILREVLSVLAEHPDGRQARDVIASVESQLELSEFESGTYPNNPDVRRFPKITRFTTINAVKAGWLVKDSGIWSITEEGLRALQEIADPEQLMREAIRLYVVWKQDQGAAVVAEPEEGAAEEATAEAVQSPGLAYEEASETAALEIRAHLDEMDPYDFQDLIAALLRGMGYHVTWVAPRGPDGGLDLTAQRDPLGADGLRVKVQVKRRQAKATSEDLRSFLALLGDHDIGVFVSLGGFTSDAALLQRQQERRRVTLISFTGLLELWIEHLPSIEEKGRRLLPLQPVHYLAPGTG